MRIFGVENEIIQDSSDKINKTFKNLSKTQKLKNNKNEILTRVLSIKALEKPIFLTFSTKKVLNYLKQVFIKVPIL